MADSKRLAFIKALTEHIRSEVDGTGLYTNDLTVEPLQVTRGVLYVDDHDPLPSVQLLENIDPDRYPRRAGGEWEHPTQKEDLIILITGHVEDDKEHPSDEAYGLLADVKMALAKLVFRGDPTRAQETHPNYMLGGLITGMTMEPGTVRPPQEQNSSAAFFWMRVVFKFVEDPNNPYALD